MLRRITLFLTALILMLALSVSASANVGASQVQITAVLDADGSAQVSITAVLYLDSTEGLTFPVPANARGITLNGKGVSTRSGGEFLRVDLSRMGGNALSLHYTVPNTVSYNEKGRPQLTLPLLCGFSYPMEGLQFYLTVPEAITATPHFYSGYHQQSLTDLVWEKSGNQITGALNSTLKDHETLSVTLELSENTFPKSRVEPWSAGLEDTIAFVLMGLAVIYWFIFLRCAPHIRRKTALPPAGCTAGQLRCILTGQGADLTMMVFSWAQLGYVLIHCQRSGKVVLHKRMDMGKERSEFENRIFRSLFSKKNSVDSTGYHYARLCRKVAASRSCDQELFRKTSGNPIGLRALAVGAGIMSGASLAIGLAGDALLAVLVILLFGIVGGIAAWMMQEWVQGLHLRNTKLLILALSIGLGWILLGFMAGEAGLAAGMVAFQLLVGLGWAYCGRRTPIGRQNTAQVLGLRAWLSKMPQEDLDRIENTDPDYFFTMAPYALALGVDTAFAKQFGRRKLSPCSWLTSGMDGHMTALEWSREMRRAADSLDERQKRLPWERLMGR